MSNYLENIHTPEDVKNLSQKELENLSQELRDKIIDTVSKNGGHLASNLGSIELTVALMKVFSFNEDKIIWDVGHQAYAYKILTGRKDNFDTLRKRAGVSGFPNRSESKYDFFSVGHASTSISAALGYASAMENKNETGSVIAVIGDGALSGGLAYEGLNNAGRLHRNLIVILNDNKMSISRNVGSMSRYLAYMRSAPGYLKAKGTVESALYKIPLIGKPLRTFLFSVKSMLKHIIYGSNLFENLGFSYYGPLNGHDIPELVSVFENVKKINRPVLVHIVTDKGKGYGPAKENPGKFHGVSSFDKETGAMAQCSKSFSDIFGETLCELAEGDSSICAITAAMKYGTGLVDFSKKFRNRFYDVGIAEEHAITYAAALAAGEMKPVFAVYSTFLQRGYDQILHDAALQKVNITLAIDRAGIVGDDGETHQGIFDAAILKTVPNISVYSPAYFEEFSQMLKKCINENCVSAVRYPKGTQGYIPEDYVYSGESFYIKENSKTLIITYGRLFSNVSKAADKLSASVMKLNRITPIDEKAVVLAMNFDRVYFYEEGVLRGGIAESFAAMLFEREYKGKFKIFAIENQFIPHMSKDEAFCELRLDTNSIYEDVLKEEKGDI